LSIPFCIGMSHAAGAADDCLAKPNRSAHAGSHWYYRIDRATQRHCWYLKELRAASPASAPGAPQESKEAVTSPKAGDQPSFIAWLSTVLNADKRPDTAAAAPAPAGRAMPELPARPAAKARRPQAAQATPDPSSARPAAAQAQEKAPPLDLAEREALFRDFLRWREQQLFAPAQ
jgi:hypothetical protein